MADDAQFFADTRSPHINTDIGSVTLTTTDKALYPAANFPSLGSNYWDFSGKAIKIEMFGRYTSQTSPGNLTISVYWGTGADANGTVISASAAVALQASQTNLSWYFVYYVHARTLGSSGTLFGTGWFLPSVALILSTAQPVLLPASAPAASASMDITTASIVSVQMKYSGSATQTAQVHELKVTALN